MAPLAGGMRSDLDRAIVRARKAAEAGAARALESLAVEANEAYPEMSAEQRRLRVQLRVRTRALGSGDLLKEEVAYEQWHRMLFARFLAENGLLLHPELGVPVTAEEAEDLAREEGEPDAWSVAARYAAAMLPGIFGSEDPAAQVRLAPEDRHALNTILATLPSEVFTSDDGLGWVYQFWQSEKKKEVNRSERKIGGADLAPVTQLFTEHYMVRFLLENSLGAWWATRHPESPLVKTFEYLRFREDGTPAAGTFSGWPERAAEVTVMDPCCGSGHFLVAAFEMLRRMRMEEEGLGEREAAEAVLRDNLFGLEIDARCVQIAAFSLALAAWRAGGYRPLPPLNLACSGIAVAGGLKEWEKLAGDDAALRTSLGRLHALFKDAPTFGSLIDPTHVQARDRMFEADDERIQTALERALARERGEADPVAALFGEAARGVTQAARLLGNRYTLVATNVPYLARGKQSESLRLFIETQHPEAKADLATAFVERCRAFAAPGGAYALVTPQNWLFLGSYKKLRERLLREQSLTMFTLLGEEAWWTFGIRGPRTVISVWTNAVPAATAIAIGIDVSSGGGREPILIPEKDRVLRAGPLVELMQAAQLRNPDARITMSNKSSDVTRLDSFASVLQGVGTTDTPRFVVRFWELPQVTSEWEHYQLASNGEYFSGYTSLLRWEHGEGDLAKIGTAHKGRSAIGKRGVAIAVTRTLSAASFLGTRFDCTVAVLIPNNREFETAISCYLTSELFKENVRELDQAVSITESSFVKVAFDLDHWQRVAAEQYPNGLPEPHSDDPTQWLFNGQPYGSDTPLQVAVARLVGYCWPEQPTDHNALDALADTDGIVSLAPLGGDRGGADRLRALLAIAFGEAWSPAEEERLLAAVDFAGKGLEAWLADGFFSQHCHLFHNRPFIWHIWDGRRDGFNVLVNYHKLDRRNLERLTETYLGEWIAARRSEAQRDVPGAALRLGAAEALQAKLRLILEGEATDDHIDGYDIYVRWKPLHEQSMGWEPDLNDGVRLNIRPFVRAGVLRSRFTINWNKDRGKEPDGSERLNHLHFTLAEKRAARAAQITGSR